MNNKPDRCRKIVLNAIIRLGSANDREISQYLNWGINRIVPRRLELVKKQLVILDAKRKDEYTGKVVSYWKAVV